MHINPVLVIAGSARPLRRSPAIAAWVAGLGAAATGRAFEVVDLGAMDLAYDAEPGLPALGVYASETTRAWSARVAGAAAVVFVTPQYNWGYPAPLKNAIDRLYSEWRGKPGIILAYGGHGGDRCESQLREVLTGVGMILTPSVPGLRIPRARIEADDGMAAPEADFSDRSEDVRGALRVLVDLIA